MGDNMLKGYEAKMLDRLENYSAQNYRKIRVKNEQTSTGIQNVERAIAILERKGFKRVDLGEVNCNCTQYEPTEDVLHYIHHGCGIDPPRELQWRMFHLGKDYPSKLTDILGSSEKYDEFMDAMWGIECFSAEILSVVLRLYGIRAVFFNYEGKFCFTHPKDTSRDIESQQLAFFPVMEGHFIVMMR